MSYNFAGLLLVGFFIGSLLLRRFIGFKFSIILLLILAILNAFYSSIWSTLLNFSISINGSSSYSDPLDGTNAFFVAFLFEILGIILGQVLGKIWRKNSRLN